MEFTQHIAITQPIEEEDNVTITDEAYKNVVALINQQNKPNLFLRLYVTGAGCSGVSFGLALDTKELEGDTKFQVKDVTVVIDKGSYPYARNATIDFVNDGQKKGFKITAPEAQLSACSSGSCSGTC